MSENTITREDQKSLLGESPAIREMLAHVSALAPLNRPVLITGERGTGKELVANRLMFLSTRWNRPYITLNCGALSEALLDSELFGHEAGAFTGATRRRASRFELADGGTLFLDEIGNAPDSVQEKLLRVIEYGSFERVGGNETIRADVRVIAATNADLRAAVTAKKFRADLLDRLAFDVIIIPPLRAREGDVLLLAQYFAERMTAELGREFFAGFTDAAAQTLAAHSWPGNVRELRNTVERSVYRMVDARKKLAEVILDPFGTETPPAAAPATPVTKVAAGPFRERVDAFEKELLQQALEAARFNQKTAAGFVGLGYHQFRNALKKHGIQSSVVSRRSSEHA
jgi:psp operon transcriptional activator